MVEGFECISCILNFNIYFALDSYASVSMQLRSVVIELI